MTEITPFTFPTTGHAVRTLLADGEPWFVASDVTEILGYVNGRSAVARHVDEEDRREYRRSEAVADRYPFDDLRIQSVSLINESGLYSLILRSDVPGAREFKRWVTAEVLPAIRRTGTYSATAPVPIEATINRLAEMAHDQHVVPVAGRILAFKRWRKPRKGIEAYVQLVLDINEPKPGGDSANAKALPGNDGVS